MEEDKKKKLVIKKKKPSIKVSISKKTESEENLEESLFSEKNIQDTKNQENEKKEEKNESLQNQPIKEETKPPFENQDNIKQPPKDKNTYQPDDKKQDNRYPPRDRTQNNQYPPRDRTQNSQYPPRDRNNQYPPRDRTQNSQYPPRDGNNQYPPRDRTQDNRFPPRDKDSKDKDAGKKKIFIKKNKPGTFQDFKDKKDNKMKDETLSLIEKEKENKKVSKVDWKKKKLEKDLLLEKELEKEKNFIFNKFSHNKKHKQVNQGAAIPSEIEIADTILVKDLAKKMNLKVGDLLSKLLSLGYMATINDAVDAETAEIVATEFGCHVTIKSIYEELQKLEEIDPESFDDNDQVIRPPIVTIMGHVDHGKTTLLDFIRKSNIAGKESGGITQHIGSYQIELPKGKITFIDTPGHAAFTEMRERGALATDIVILVVAADDGVMPQTLEALNHAKAANVPIIVAVNKIDKPGANLERIKQQLSEHGLVPEEWGGHTLFKPVSAIKGDGVQELLEAILLEAEMKDLKANPKKNAKAVIIETKVDKGKGIIANVIVRDGTLKKGDIFISGTQYGRIRAMFDHLGEAINEAPPSTPIELIGFTELPSAGDILLTVANEKKAKEITDKRIEITRIEHAKKVTKKVSLDDLYQQMQDGQKIDFNIIVKADVQGTADAIKNMVEKFADRLLEVNLKVIHNGVGEISENDVRLASASKAIIIGFNVRPNSTGNQLAKEKGVEIRKYSIIYEIVDDLKFAIEGMLEPEQKEIVLGQIEVRDVFKVPKIGVIAGAYVTDGVVKRTASVRVIRENIVIHSGKIDSLKRFKDDVKEVTKGYECGVGIANYNDIKSGDNLEVFEIQSIAKKLSMKDNNENQS
ncbi:MAG: translation initiation factor IF-2 [Spirochaetes bacterium GWB1_36_13]|nr:MAG: translation initiation factor IF-2 [Spirochaetes bacterium GWB1_36_13]